MQLTQLNEDVEPMPADALPAAQLTHTVAPESDWKVPASQLTQLAELVAPEVTERVPAGQIVQPVDPLLA